MRYLGLGELLLLYRQVMQGSGGATGIRDLGAVESAIAQPMASFEGRELYPDLVEKAASLCFPLIRNHGFVDGNKRIAHAAMETFLLLNGHEVDADVEEQEEVVLRLASGSLERATFCSWLRAHVVDRRGTGPTTE